MRTYTDDQLSELVSIVVDLAQPIQTNVGYMVLSDRARALVASMSASVAQREASDAERADPGAA
jgi:hypothetical protein